jgi:1-acyl-sn-glycerol-3-phosphate acyltransferase
MTNGVLVEHLRLWSPFAPPLETHRWLALLSMGLVLSLAWSWLHATLPSLSSQARQATPRLIAAFALCGGSGTLLGLRLAQASLGPIERIDESQVEGIAALHFALGLLGTALLLLAPRTTANHCGPLFLTSRHSSDRAARRAWWAMFGQGFLLTYGWLTAMDAHQHMVFGTAVLIGIFLTAWRTCPQRALGFVPLGWVGATFSFIVLRLSPDSLGAWVSLGVFLGVGLVSTRSEILLRVYPTRRFVSSLLMGGAWSAGTVAGWQIFRWIGTEQRNASWGAFLAALLSLFAIRSFFRELLELLVEPVLSTMYRIAAYGSGVHQLPTRGPVIVIANHAAWFDPLWIAKVMPFRVRPMMTARFYDLPCISWLMRNVFFTIRVPENRFRREAPEIQVAIAAIDQGDNLLIFPEGWLRRKEEVVLRRFGHGIHQILASRPQTPVIACWIEGGWGSYVSHKDGPPMKNKPFDFLRRIRIGVNDPEIVPADILADHWRTRHYLMVSVLQARRHLNLPEVTPPIFETDPHTDHDTADNEASHLDPSTNA